MDRRDVFSLALGRRLANRPGSPPDPASGFMPYTGPWNFEQAAHLLRRTTFGPGQDQIRQAVSDGLEATLDKLFATLPLPEPPLNYKPGKDSVVPVGESWINAPNPFPTDGQDFIAHRRVSLTSWWIGEMWQEGVHIREKLTLFWHNHLPIGGITDAKFRYHYLNLLRTHAWGNFRQLVKEITIAPAMLEYLDGNINEATAPNENYARELLELFTIGKKPQETPGDYGTFTEDDVREIARALTGWRAYGGGYNDEYPDGDYGAAFTPEEHDDGIKQLSHRFGNQTIQNLGAEEYKAVIDIVFGQFEVARFICRKLYQWFIYYDITEAAEEAVIEPMAQLLWQNDFEIAPALRALLSSEHFFDPGYYGVKIKNPADFMLSALKPLQVAYSQGLNEKYDAWYRISDCFKPLQMSLLEIPEVAGWKAYYREPLYYRHWINATTLPERESLMNALVYSGIWPFEANGIRMRVDVLEFITTIDNPSDPNAVVEAFTKILLPRPLSEQQYATLKEVLLDGLPDFEWTVDYGTYAESPDDSNLAIPIRDRLRALLSAILSMPEFHLQ